MKKAMLIIVAACFAWPAYGAETGEITEIFACNLKDGQSMADFDAAANAWKKDMEGNAAMKNYFAAVLVPYRTNGKYDLVWIGSNPNLNDWGKTASIDYTPAGRAAQARFDKVVKCDSGLHQSVTLYEALADAQPNDPPAAVETYGCKLNAGKTLADVAAVEKNWLATVNGMKTKTPDLVKFSNYRYTPWFADTKYDVMYLTVNHDLASFAATTTAWQTSVEGPKSDAAIAAVETCKSGLWMGHVLVAPAPPPKM